MHIPEDFVPDFTNKLTTGLICNRHSKVKQIGNLSYISLFNRVNVWNIRTQELMFSFGTQKHQISHFIVGEDAALLGYENGVVEIIKNLSSVEERSSKVLKLHLKKITQIQQIGDLVVSSSLDGSLCAYDLVIEEVKLRFEGNSASIDGFFIDQSKILAVCADKTVKIWSISSEQLVDAIAFDEYVFGVVARGNEALVIFTNGDSNTLNLGTKERRQFEKFKNQRNLLLKGNKVVVQCQKKTILYSISSESGLGLVPLSRMVTSQDFVDLDYSDGCLTYISKKNKIHHSDETIDFGFHEEEILDIKIDHNKIFTLSRDRVVYWTRSQDNPLRELEKFEDGRVDEEQFICNRLEFHSFIAVKNATCFDLFSNFIIIGNAEGIRIFDRNFFELKDEMKLGKVLSLSAFGSVLAVSVDSTISFYNPEFQEIDSRAVPDTVIHSQFSGDGASFVCSCLDSKVYVFSYPSMDLRANLYGHSLPVRHFSISSDSKLLLTAGADKLIKIWGLEFGECRKTLVGNSKNVEFMHDTLFMFCDKSIEYYNNVERLRSFKVFSPGIVKFGTDYMIATSGRGLSLFTMNRYEFIREEDSSEIENVAIKTIANIKDYDSFLDHLQRIEKDFNEPAVSEFYGFLEGSDMNELKEYMYVLDHTFIRLILSTIEANLSKNSIVNARVLIQLFRSHKDVCLSSDVFYRMKDQLLEKIRDLRNLYGINEASLEIDINDAGIEDSQVL